MDERVITFAEAINEALKQSMMKDPEVILLGENVTSSWRPTTKGLLEEFGRERVRDTPISETAFIGTGIGASILGMRPVVELMLVDFGLVAMDQILNQLAKTHYMSGGVVKTPLTIRASYGGGTSSGATHSESLYSLFAHMPGVKVVVPSNPFDAKGLLISSIRNDDPEIFMEQRLLYDLKGPVPSEDYVLPLGEAKIVRQGDDVTVFTVGRMVHEALQAAQDLKNKVSVEVIDARTVVPLDEKALISSIEKTGRLVVVDEDYERCGFSAEVAAIAANKAFEYLKAPILRVAAPNAPIPYNPTLEKNHLPNKDKIVSAIKSVARYA